MFNTFLFFGLKPLFLMCFGNRTAIFKDTPKKKKKDTICEHSCANCSCQNVLVFCIFHFLGFGISNFRRDDFDRTQKQNCKANTRNKQKLVNKMQIVRKSSLVFQNKTRQQAETTKQHLETKSKQNKNKYQKPKTQMRNKS